MTKTEMSIDQFVEALRAKVKETKATFDKLSGQYLQTETGCMCPIEFVAGAYNAFTVAAEKLGLSDDDVCRIVNAADRTTGWSPQGHLSDGGLYVVPGLRNRLLEACGLPKEA